MGNVFLFSSIVLAHFGTLESLSQTFGNMFSRPMYLLSLIAEMS